MKALAFILDQKSYCIRCILKIAKEEAKGYIHLFFLTIKTKRVDENDICENCNNTFKENRKQILDETLHYVKGI